MYYRKKQATGFGSSAKINLHLNDSTQFSVRIEKTAYFSVLQEARTRPVESQT